MHRKHNHFQIIRYDFITRPILNCDINVERVNNSALESTNIFQSESEQTECNQM